MADTVRARDAEANGVMLASAVLLGAAGAATVVTCAQFLGWWSLLPTERTAVIGLLLLGVLGLGAAWGLGRARTWAAVLGTVVAPLLALGTTAWAMFCLVNLSFSVYGVLAPPLAALATGLLPFTIPMARRCTRAREALDARVRDAGVFSS